MMPLFDKRTGFKPLEYPWAYEAFVKSEQMHWLPREVPLNSDVNQWKNVLSDEERNLLTQIFRFFTQADVDVASAYIDSYLPKFQPTELRMMMTSIAAREAVHIQAYSMLIDEVGIPETEYAAFMEYQEMREKHEYMFQEREGMQGLAEDIAVFSAFGEGLQLFASFVILLNFTRFEKMTGMGQIVAWSIRDETHHVQSMIKLYHTLLEERPDIDVDLLNDRVREIAKEMVYLEDRFIELAFREGGVEGLTASEVKSYIRYIADVRLQQLGIEPIYGFEKNPLPWVDVLVFGKEHTNFFENRATDYSAGAIEGSWEDAFEDAPAQEQSASEGASAPEQELWEDFPKDRYTVLSKNGCSECEKAKTLLSVKGLPYDVKMFTSSEDMERFKSYGFRSFPQIYFDGQLIGGFDNLKRHLGVN